MERSTGGAGRPRASRAVSLRGPADSAGSRQPAPPAREGRPGTSGGPPVGRPAVDDDADPGELPDLVRRELRSLPPALAEQVGKHLVMAGRLESGDPEAAYEHGRAARELASRIAPVREAAGVTAYRAGRYAEALAELRAARRMTGLPDYLPMMADCERGLGRPHRALALAGERDAARLDRAGLVELRIVAAGARRDLGQLDAALMTLQGPDLEPAVVEDWTPRLWYAYADALLASGRTEEALEWFRAAAEVDDDDLTDAEQRFLALSPDPGDGGRPVVPLPGERTE